MRRWRFKSWTFVFFRSRGSSHDSKYGDIVVFVSSRGVSLRARGVIFHYSPGVSQRLRARIAVKWRFDRWFFDELTVWTLETAFLALLIYQLTFAHEDRRSHRVNHRRSCLSQAIRIVLPRSGPMGVFSDLVLGLPVICPQTWLSALSMSSCLMSWQFLALAALPIRYPRYPTHRSSVVGLLLVLTYAGSKVLGANIQVDIKAAARYGVYGERRLVNATDQVQVCT
ncbi:hypothetical protein EDB87DRAFT_1616 [Lactarius vividus]|nr:hypothetical protein EDB87DRAFT_1616 [Lactarius vividus]